MREIRGQGPGRFFVDRGRDARAVRATCASCPVISVCLEWALSQPETPYGVWGGMSFRELVAESKRRRALRVA